MKKFAIPILCLFILAACGGENNNQGTSNKKIHSAVYAIVGYCSNYDILYQTPDGIISESSDHSVWLHSFDAQEGDYLSLHVSSPQCIYPFDAYLILNGEKISKGSCFDPNCQEIILNHIIAHQPSPR